MLSGGNSYLTNCELVNNTAETSGGAIHAEGGALNVKDSEFVMNSAVEGVCHPAHLYTPSFCGACPACLDSANHNPSRRPPMHLLHHKPLAPCRASPPQAHVPPYLGPSPTLAAFRPSTLTCPLTTCHPCKPLHLLVLTLFRHTPTPHPPPSTQPAQHPLLRTPFWVLLFHHCTCTR